MVFNVSVHRGRMATGFVGLLLVAAACSNGAPDYTYVESEDGHVYGKIPADWEVDREGAVDYTMITKDNMVQFAFTPGDTTQPWRADFSAAGPSGDGPTGLFEAQHLDARVREGFRLGSFIDDQRAEYDDYERENWGRDGLIGYRVRFTTTGDDPKTFEEVWFMDERRSGVYRAAVSCSPDCADDYAREIDEIVTTFRVEP